MSRKTSLAALLLVGIGLVACGPQDGLPGLADNAGQEPVSARSAAVIDQSFINSLNDAANKGNLYALHDTGPWMIGNGCPACHRSIPLYSLSAGVAAGLYVPRDSWRGIIGRYFSDGQDPKVANGVRLSDYRLDATIDYDWGGGAPAPNTTADQFDIVWDGLLVPPSTGSYTFTIGSDDGGQIWSGYTGDWLVNQWIDRGYTETTSGAVSMTANDARRIYVRMFENGGAAAARFKYTPPGGALQVVPSAQLRPWSVDWLAKFHADYQVRNGWNFWAHDSFYTHSNTEGAFAMWGLAAYTANTGNTSYLPRLKQATEWLIAPKFPDGTTYNINHTTGGDTEVLTRRAWCYHEPRWNSTRQGDGRWTITFPSDALPYGGASAYIIPGDWWCGWPTFYRWPQNNGMFSAAISMYLATDPSITSSDRTRYLAFRDSLGDALAGAFYRKPSYEQDYWDYGPNPNVRYVVQNVTDYSIQELSYMLIGLTTSLKNNPPVDANRRAAWQTAINDIAANILSRKVGSTGWSDSISFPTDNTIQPFTTGEAILGLCLAGIRMDHPTHGQKIQDALTYLKSSQNQDGGWSYGGYTRDLPSSYATLGLSCFGVLQVNTSISNINPADVDTTKAKISPSLAGTQQVTFRLNVENAGYVTNSFTFAASGGYGATTFSFSPTSLTLAPNTTGFTTVTATFPANLPASVAAPITVTTTYNGNSGPATKNNTLTVNIGSVVDPGAGALFTQTAFTAGPGSTVRVGDNLTLTATVKKSDNTFVPGGAVQFYIGGSVVATVPWSNGTYSATVVVPAVSGNQTISASYQGASVSGTSYAQSSASGTITVNLPNVPNTPSVTAPTNGTVTTANTPSFTGTVTSDSNAPITITVKEGGVNVGSGTVTAGAFNFTVALGDGVHTVSVLASNAGGNSAAVTLTITIAPPAPSITTPANNASVGPGAFTIAGVTRASTAVAIKEGATSVVTPTSDAAGNYSASVTLTPGPHTLSATITSNGVTSSATSVTVNVQPAAPAFTAPANNSTLASNSTTFTGTAYANSTVTLYEGATTLGTATADAAGNWSRAVTFGTVGAHSVTAKATVSGVQGPASAALTVTASPPAPALTTPAAAATVTGAVADGSYVQTVAGTAIANASVGIYDNATLIKTVTADAAGNFSTTVTLALGAHPLNIKQTVSALTGPASAALTITVSAPAVPSAPTLTAPANGYSSTNGNVTFSGAAQTDSTVTILDGASNLVTTPRVVGGAYSIAGALAIGVHSITAKATNSGGTSAASGAITVTIVPGAPLITAPANNSTQSGAFTLSGTAVASASVVIKEGATTLATVTAAGGSYSSSLTLTPGPHTLSVTATLNSATSAASTLAVNVQPAAPVISAPAAASTLPSNTATVSGTAYASSTVTVYDGATTLGTATADGAGNWSLAVTFSAVGAHSLTAKATVGGVPGPASAAVSVTSSPPAPTVTLPAASGSVSGAVADGTYVQTVSGTAVASASVGVFDNGALIKTISADAAGNFSTTVTLALGAHPLSAKQTVSALTGPASAAVTITVTPPAAPPTPTLTAPVNGYSSTNGNVTFSGTAQTDSTVTILDGVSNLVTTPRVAAGTYSIAGALAIGVHSITAKATNSGGTSAATGAITVTIAPAAPVVSSPANNATLAGAFNVTGTAVVGSALAIKEGATSLATVAVPAGGAFSQSLSLVPGPHTLTLTATLNGVTSATTTVTVNVQAGAPAITAPADNTTLSANAVTVVGTAYPSSTVNIYDGATVAGTTTAAANGAFNVNVTLDPPGAHVLTARATVGGVQGPASSGVTVNAAPVAPVITTPAANSVVTTPNATYSLSVVGTALANASVAVYDNGALSKTLTANGAGAFSTTLTLNNGVHVIVAKQTVAGLTSLNSSPRTVEVQADTDGDGVADLTDNCVTVWNADQLNSDADGIGDVCDYTPGFSDATNMATNSTDSSIVTDPMAETNSRQNPLYAAESKVCGITMPAGGHPTRSTMTLIQTPPGMGNIEVIARSATGAMPVVVATYKGRVGATSPVTFSGQPTVRVLAPRGNPVSVSYRNKTLAARVREANGTFVELPNCQSGQKSMDNRCSRVNISYLTVEGTTVETGYAIDFEVNSL